MSFQKFKDFNTKTSSGSGGGNDLPDIIVNAPLLPGTTISKGDIVEIVDGGVRKTTCKWNLSGTPVNMGIPVQVQTSRVFQLSSNKFLMAYSAATPQDFGVILLTRTGTNAFSVGTPFVIGSSTGYNNFDFHLEKLANGKYMLFFNGKMGAAILSIDLGTGEISLNRLQIGETALAANSTTMKVFKYSETKFIAFYATTDNNLRYMIFNVDLLANTIALTAPAVVGAFTAAGSSLWGFSYGINKWVIFAGSGTNYTVPWAVIELVDPDANIVSVRNSGVFSNFSTNSVGRVQGFTYSETRGVLLVSYGSSQVLRTINFAFDSALNTVSNLGEVDLTLYPYPNGFSIWKVLPVGANVIALLGASRTTSPYGVGVIVCKLVKNNNGLINVTPMERFDYMHGNYTLNSGDLLRFDNVGTHMVFYQEPPNYFSRVLEIPIRVLNPVGVALDDRSAGNVTIQMQGIVTGLKDLVPGHTYYVNDEGNLSRFSQSSPYKVGVALSNNSLIISELLKQNQVYT